MSDARNPVRRQVLTAAVAACSLAVLPGRASEAVDTRNRQGAAMTKLTPYLLFDGNSRQAMEFYRSCLGGELTIMKVMDSPAKDHMPAFQQEKAVNAHLVSGSVEISASDWLRPDRVRLQGNTNCLYLSEGSPAELRSHFEKLSEGAEVTDPLTEQFFGIYGALNDRFGVRWMFQAATAA
jgi:PhnB protein